MRDSDFPAKLRDFRELACTPCTRLHAQAIYILWRDVVCSVVVSGGD